MGCPCCRAALSRVFPAVIPVPGRDSSRVRLNSAPFYESPMFGYSVFIVTGAEYRTVFDITRTGVEWWFPAAGAAMALLGLFEVSNHSGRRSAWRGWLLVVIGASWAVSFGSWELYQRHKLIKAFDTGAYATVEGNVENFDPMPATGHRNECFSVRSARFCYSDYVLSPGFHQSASHGGPIRQGLHVRVAYVGDDIVRLQVQGGQANSGNVRQSPR